MPNPVKTVAVVPSQLARPRRVGEHLPGSLDLSPPRGQPRSDPRARRQMRPPRRRRRDRCGHRQVCHPNAAPGRDEQRPVATLHRIPRKPPLPLKPSSMTPRRHLTPTHRTPPRTQRRRPHPHQPLQPPHRPRTSTKHPTHHNTPTPGLIATPHMARLRPRHTRHHRQNTDYQHHTTWGAGSQCSVDGQTPMAAGAQTGLGVSRRETLQSAVWSAPAGRFEAASSTMTSRSSRLTRSAAVKLVGDRARHL